MNSQHLFIKIPAGLSIAPIRSHPKVSSKGLKEKKWDAPHLGSSSFGRFGQYFFTRFLNGREEDIKAKGTV